jgi:hypothetical protein
MGEIDGKGEDSAIRVERAISNQSVQMGVEVDESAEGLNSKAPAVVSGVACGFAMPFATA